MWVGAGGHDARVGAAPLLPPRPALARGDVEVPARLLGRHRARAPRLVLPRATRRCARGCTRRCSSTTWSRAGAPAVAALARTRPSCCSSSATARRWASRRCTRGSPTRTARRPASCRRCSRGRAHELRLPRHPAVLSDLQRRRRGEPSRARLMIAVGPAVDGGRGRLHGPAAGLQAHARLLERRAHGHPGRSASASAARASSARCCTCQQRAHQGRALPVRGNIHRAFGSKSTDDVSGALRRVPAPGALFLAGFFAITGSPPFGPFLSEFTILSAAVSQGRLRRRRRFPGPARRRLHRDGRDRARRGAGKPRDDASPTRVPDEDFLTVAPDCASCWPSS